MKPELIKIKITPHQFISSLLRSILAVAFAIAALAAFVYASDYIGIYPSLAVLILVMVLIGFLSRGRDIIDELRVTDTSFDFYTHGILKKSVPMQEIGWFKVTLYCNRIRTGDTYSSFLSIFYASGKEEKYSFSNLASFDDSAFRRFESVMANVLQFEKINQEPEHKRHLTDFTRGEPRDLAIYQIRTVNTR